jgi:alkaline phosphatase D
MRSIPYFLLFLFLVSAAQSQIRSGPMNGFADHREAALWIQTKSAATVAFRFREKGTSNLFRFTDSRQTEKGTAFTATLIADSLLPGKRYEYEVWVNGKKEGTPGLYSFQTPPLWMHRTDPPEFSVAVGSCTYVNESIWDRPGKGYGDSMEIFKSIAAQKPDLMLWIGDNTYTREGDWNSRGGFMHRYTHTRSLPEMQELLSSAQHYATWDDHEYGPNDSDRSFWNKDISAETFRTFWPLPSQPLGKGPVTSTFSWGDCQFFMLDDRWFRASNNSRDSSRDYLGEQQLNWLLDALIFSRANFKIIACGGQVLNDARVFENYAQYPVERRKLISRISEAGIPGVFFLSGDRHHAELTRLERNGKYPLYDLTTSPLTAGIHNPGNEANTLRMAGTLFNGHNFALLRFSGPAKERVMQIQLKDNQGRTVWEKSIKAEELK